MARNKQRRNRSNDGVFESQEDREMISFLPPESIAGKKVPLVPYIHSTAFDKNEVVINGSTLKTTACSSNKWKAPTS